MSTLLRAAIQEAVQRGLDLGLQPIEAETYALNMASAPHMVLVVVDGKIPGIGWFDQSWKAPQVIKMVMEPVEL